MGDTLSSQPYENSFMEHTLKVTDVVCGRGGCNAIIISSSEDHHQGSAAAADMELERLWLDCKRSMQMTEKWKKMYQGILDLSIDDLLDSAQSRDAKEKPRGRNRSKISSYNIKEDDPLITVKSIYKGPRD